LGEAGVIAIFSQSMLTGKQPIINGTGEQTRDYVYVEDVARINVLALKDDIKGTFNVGTGKETTVNYLFTKIQSLTHAGALEVHGEPKKGEQFRSVLSAKKAKQTLGWEPKVEFDEGLKRTIEFFKAKI
jgi:UDP-glucose 4-epimerase